MKKLKRWLVAPAARLSRRQADDAMSRGGPEEDIGGEWPGQSLELATREVRKAPGARALLQPAFTTREAMDMPVPATFAQADEDPDHLSGGAILPEEDPLEESDPALPMQRDGEPVAEIADHANPSLPNQSESSHPAMLPAADRFRRTVGELVATGLASAKNQTRWYGRGAEKLFDAEAPKVSRRLRHAYKERNPRKTPRR
ncbi:hypothetical protein [Erythrobacter sp.]|uniref:hypothetical protein n=1 Tax=Erythrobacter sp. TaxID=1042 RepID=UPI003C737280